VPLEVIMTTVRSTRVENSYSRHIGITERKDTRKLSPVLSITLTTYRRRAENSTRSRRGLLATVATPMGKEQPVRCG